MTRTYRRQAAACALAAIAAASSGCSGSRQPTPAGVARLNVLFIAVEGDGISYGLSYCPTCASPYPNALPPFKRGPVAIH